MPRVYRKKGADARNTHLSVLMTKESHERCRHVAKMAGFDSVSAWANMVLMRAVSATQGHAGAEKRVVAA